MKFKKDKNIVLLEGMGFVLFEENVKSKITRSELSRFCDIYSMPAFGAVIYNKNNITPYIYVKKIDSFGKETACGSGSIAFSIFSGISDIIQPTGETISVRIGALIEISAKVKKYE